jgi:hypothetical protein
MSFTYPVSPTSLMAAEKWGGRGVEQNWRRRRVEEVLGDTRERERVRGSE